MGHWSHMPSPTHHLEAGAPANFMQSMGDKARRPGCLFAFQDQDWHLETSVRLKPNTTREQGAEVEAGLRDVAHQVRLDVGFHASPRSISIDRKSTRLNSSHANISYAVFCLKKKKKNKYVINVKTM